MKKNILFLVADDQRFDTIHALGNSEIQTPNLDLLVKNGVAFTEAFIPGGSSGAVCMPSRAMIQTGRYLTAWENCGETIPREHALLGECLREYGYQTCGIGKWHNGTDSYHRSFSQGSEIFFGGMWDHWNVPVNSFHEDGSYNQLKTFTKDPFATNQTMKLPAEKVTLGKHSTDLFADAIIAAIQENASKENPFFIYGSFLAPHDPRTMPPEFQQMYSPDEITLPPNFLPEHPFLFDIRGERDETLEKYPRTEKAIRQHLADYYAMISHIDARIGDIIESLKTEGIFEETLIVFTGDNGLAIGQHGLMGKQNLYDASIRVPLIFSGPELPQNKKVVGKCLLLDIMPTIIDYIGLSIPSEIQGQSLLAQIDGQSSQARSDLYLQFTDKIRGIVTNEYKYLEYRTKQGTYQQLFHRENDPYELVNLSYQPDQQRRIQQLQEKMYALAVLYKDTEFSQGQQFWQKERASLK